MLEWPQGHFLAWKYEDQGLGNICACILPAHPSMATSSKGHHDAPRDNLLSKDKCDEWSFAVTGVTYDVFAFFK